MKAYTDGTKVYTIGSLGPGCWKHIRIYTLQEWLGEKAISWMLTAEHIAYKFLKEKEYGTDWIEDVKAENALNVCAKEFGWKEI
jgi:hypothetical protein